MSDADHRHLIVDANDFRLTQRLDGPSEPDPNGTEQRSSAIEELVRTVAVKFGLRDLVFDPIKIRKGVGDREVSDGMLIHGSRGLVVQTKSREVNATSADLSKEESWIVKHTGKAIAQGTGSIRTLRNTPHLALVNRSGREIPASTVKTWFTVVVIDHPLAASLSTTLTIDVPQCLVLSRRDWEFLLKHIRSVQALVHYIDIAARSKVLLDHESERYYQLALADRQAAQAEGSPDRVHPFDEASWHGLLPLEPVDQAGTGAFRALLVEISRCGSEALDVHRALSWLDEFPIQDRVSPTDALDHFAAEVSAKATTDQLAIATRTTFLPPGFPTLTFVVANQRSNGFPYFRALCSSRHVLRQHDSREELRAWGFS